MMHKTCIIYLISITTKSWENSFCPTTTIFGCGMQQYESLNLYTNKIAIYRSSFALLLCNCALKPELKYDKTLKSFFIQNLKKWVLLQISEVVIIYASNVPQDISPRPQTELEMGQIAVWN